MSFITVSTKFYALFTLAPGTTIVHARGLLGEPGFEARVDAAGASDVGSAIKLETSSLIDACKGSAAMRPRERPRLMGEPESSAPPAVLKRPGDSRRGELVLSMSCSASSASRPLFAMLCVGCMGSGAIDP